MTSREAFIILNLLPNVGPITVKSILKIFKDNIVAVFNKSEGDLLSLGISKKASQVIPNWEKHVNLKLELNKIQSLGLEVINFKDSIYPSILREIYDPPICLYLKGDKNCLSSQGFNLAVVGARKANNYAIENIKKITKQACERKCQIISGLAYGIDTIAHQTTVDNRGKTIAIMGHGLQYVYPKENYRLHNKILETGGLIISEFSVSTSPDKKYFPRRNRIISGLSHAVLIGQASIKSGSLITANQALNEGREIFAIPGPITKDFSGNHYLIKQGAKLTESFEDIEEEFTSFNFFKSFQSKKVNNSTKNINDFNLSEEEKTILIFLAKKNKHDLESIAEGTNMSIGQLMALLTQMEMKKLIYAQGQNYFLTNT